MLLFILVLAESKNIDYYSANPVAVHCIPYTQNIHIHYPDEKIGKSHPEDTHGNYCHYHGKCGLSYGPEIIRQEEGQGPQEHGKYMRDQ